MDPSDSQARTFAAPPSSTWTAAAASAPLLARHRLLVEGSRCEQDWKASEAAARVLALLRPDAHAVNAVLSFWSDRFVAIYEPGPAFEEVEEEATRTYLQQIHQSFG